MRENLSGIPFELKELSDEGEFTGYASIFGNKDLGADVVVPGAFTKTLSERGDKVRLLDGHGTRIGIANVRESQQGLEVAKAKINLGKQAGRDAYSDLKFYRDQGLPMGMSIGYEPVKADYSHSDQARHLKEVRLWEVSITEFPMNEKAQVMSVKSDAPTKSVDGVDLTAESFAYVGDPKKTETWKLPINFPGDKEKTQAHIRNALARFSQTQGIPDTERDAVLSRIKAAAKRNGIDVSDGKSGRRHSASTLAHMRAAMENLQALLEDEADEAVTSDPEAAISSKSEPVIDHSEISSLLKEAKESFRWNLKSN